MKQKMLVREKKARAILKRTFLEKYDGIQFCNTRLPHYQCPAKEIANIVEENDEGEAETLDKNKVFWFSKDESIKLSFNDVANELGL